MGQVMTPTFLENFLSCSNYGYHSYGLRYGWAQEIVYILETCFSGSYAMTAFADPEQEVGPLEKCSSSSIPCCVKIIYLYLLPICTIFVLELIPLDRP